MNLRRRILGQNTRNLVENHMKKLSSQSSKYHQKAILSKKKLKQKNCFRLKAIPSKEKVTTVNNSNLCKPCQISIQNHETQETATTVNNLHFCKPCEISNQKLGTEGKPTTVIKVNSNYSTLIRPCSVVIKKFDFENPVPKYHLEKNISNKDCSLNSKTISKSATINYNFRNRTIKENDRSNAKKLIVASDMKINKEDVLCLITSTPAKARKHRNSKGSQLSKMSLQDCPIDSIASCRISVSSSDPKRARKSKNGSEKTLVEQNSAKSRRGRPKKQISIEKITGKESAVKMNQKRSCKKTYQPSNNISLRKKIAVQDQILFRSTKKSANILPKCKSLAEVATLDDLALITRNHAKRKAKSDGPKVPGKNTLKRKRTVLSEINRADDNHEDDVYESKEFGFLKDLLDDTSSEVYAPSMSTPKLGIDVTPMTRNRTRIIKDVMSPNEYARERKIAEEYLYRKSKKKVVSTPKTGPEKRKLEFSKVIANALQKEQKIQEIMNESSELDDSYFSDLQDKTIPLAP